MRYLEVRQIAVKLLKELVEIQDDYRSIVDAGGPGVVKALNLYVETVNETLAEMLGQIRSDATLSEVVSSEPTLGDCYQDACSFWRLLVVNGMVEETTRMSEIQTTLPPEPPVEITSDSVMSFLIEMRDWVVGAADELWGDEPRGLKIEPLGDRYGLGEFDQTRAIVSAYDTATTLRAQWLRLSSMGDYWDSPSVGAARAKLVYVGSAVVRTIVSPPEGSRLLTGMP